MKDVTYDFLTDPSRLPPEFKSWVIRYVASDPTLLRDIVGALTKITSTDSSVTIANPTGPIVDLSVAVPTTTDPSSAVRLGTGVTLPAGGAVTVLAGFAATQTNNSSDFGNGSTDGISVKVTGTYLAFASLSHGGIPSDLHLSLTCEGGGVTEADGADWLFSALTNYAPGTSGTALQAVAAFTVSTAPSTIRLYASTVTGYTNANANHSLLVVRVGPHYAASGWD